MKTNQVQFQAAILAGVLGTIAFDVVGYILSGTFWDVPNLLSMMLFEDAGLLPGVLAHYSNGLLLAVLYAAMAPSLWGNRWARTTIFFSAETLFGVYLFLFPLLDLGPFGHKLGAGFIAISFVRHIVFGLVVAAVYPGRLQLGITSACECSGDSCACSVAA